jgi:hypothetical protein
MDLFMNLSRPRLRALLHHLAKINDARQAWKVMDPLREVLFLVVLARYRVTTITTTSSIGATRISPCCAALPNSTSAFPAPIGCAASTASTRPVHGLSISERLMILLGCSFALGHGHRFNLRRRGCVVRGRRRACEFPAPVGAVVHQSTHLSKEVSFVKCRDRVPGRQRRQNAAQPARLIRPGSNAAECSTLPS